MIESFQKSMWDCTNLNIVINWWRKPLGNVNTSWEKKHLVGQELQVLQDDLSHFATRLKIQNCTAFADFFSIQYKINQADLSTK